jgi:type II secretory ATPase GspE/PulE/Tfp pilus assembly ATPase PilB-like protein
MERYGKDGKLTLYRAVGCDKCGKTGYKGRIGLHELMIADDAAKKLIQERARVAELFASAVTQRHADAEDGWSLWSFHSSKIRC